MTRVTDAHCVTYAPPVHAAAEVREFFARDATVESPGEIVGRLPRGRVFGSSHVLSPDGQTIARDVSLDFGRAPDKHWLLTYKKIRCPLPLPGTTAVVATTLGEGYAHWLLEELPRLLMLGSKLGGAEKLIAHATTPFARAGLALQGWRGEVIEPKRHSHFQCEQLVVPGLAAAEGRPTPAVVARLEEFVAPWDDDASTWGGRLYLTRDRAERRRVANEAELWPELERRGFARVRLEELTWREQIAALRGARVVVAPHGAGLANIAFCRPGTVVLELFNRAYVNGLFWRLAVVKGLDYRPVVPEDAEPLAEMPARGRDDIVADVPQVLQALVE